MNKFPYPALLLAALALWSARAGAQPGPDSLFFRNGDLLYGRLLAIDGQADVRWHHPDSPEAIEFKPDAIAQIDFPTPKETMTLSNNACRILLSDGDCLEGDFVSCDRDALALQTWYAGRLRIPRQSMQSLVFLPHSPAVFDGITSLDGWTEGTSSAAFPTEAGHWVYRNGAFYANKAASVARNLNLPDDAQIQFDLAWKGALNLAIAIYTDSLQPILVSAKDQAADFGGFYSLRFQNALSFSADCWPIKKGERLRSLGQVYLPAFNGKDRLHVDLRVSKARHKIALYLDDTVVKEWDDSEGFIGEGTGIRFVQNSGSPLKLSNLRVAQWDGFFTESSPDEERDTAHDAVWLANRGKIVVGIVEGVSRGKLAMLSSNGPVQMDLANVKSIDFARHTAEAPSAQSGVVRGTFADRGSLTFFLESWKPGEMIVRSPDFGRVKMNPAAFTRLQFLFPEKKSADNSKG